MPFVTFGPTYRRAVADELHRALEMFRNDHGEEFAYWIHETVNVAAKIRGAEPHDPNHYGTYATPWPVSYETTALRDYVTLCVVHNSWPLGTVRHPVHLGKAFPTQEDAHGYVWRHGLLKRSERLLGRQPRFTPPRTQRPLGDLRETWRGTQRT